MSGKHTGPGRRRPSRRDRKRGSTPEAVPAWNQLADQEVAAGEETAADAVESTFILDRDLFAEALGEQALRELADEARPRSRRRRILVGVTSAAAVLGLVTSGAVAWTMFRPSIVPTESDHATTTKIRDAWAAGNTHTGYVGIIRIPRFGKTWEFSVSRGTDLSVLAHGAGWYEDGAQPGAVGNVVVSAHRVTHNAPFHDFPSLRRGDLVELETRSAVYTYKMMDSGDAITVPDTTVWPLWDVPDPKSRNQEPTDHMLTLITCARLFHTDERLVARAELIDTSRKPVA